MCQSPPKLAGIFSFCLGGSNTPNPSTYRAYVQLSDSPWCEPVAYPGYPGMAPVPSWPAVVIKPETLSGIRSYQTNLILDLIFSTFALILGLTSFLLVASDFGTAIAAVALTGAASCGLVIVFVINFIVSLLSVTRMQHGADEYGPEHATYARRGVLFKWLGTTLSTIAAIMVVYMLLAFSGAFLLVGPGQVPAQVFIPLLITGFWTAGVTCKGQMYRNMVRALQPPHTRGLTDMASYAIPILGLVGLGLVGVLTASVISLLSNPALDAFALARSLEMLVGAVFLPAGFAIVGYAIFVIVYGQTVKQLQTGLQQLQERLMAQPMWAMGAPFYAPMPAFPSQPAPPPSAPIVPPANLVCPECGRQGPRGATFCQHCGAKLP